MHYFRVVHVGFSHFIILCQRLKQGMREIDRETCMYAFMHNQFTSARKTFTANSAFEGLDTRMRHHVLSKETTSGCMRISMGFE